MRSKTDYHMPEMPGACVRCGTPYGLTRQPLAAGGPVWRRRRVDVPFCAACWRRLATARRLAPVAAAVFAVAAGGGLALALASRAAGPALVGLAVGAAALAAGLWYLRAASPRRRGSVLEVPGAGRVDLSGRDPDR